jgi:hypothetical protein
MVDLLKKYFVAFALDNASVPNMTAAEAVWLRDRGGQSCTQGMTVFTAGGKMLGKGGGYQAAGNIKMLREALRKFTPEEKVDIGDPHVAVRTAERTLPARRPTPGQGWPGPVCELEGVEQTTRQPRSGRSRR